MGIDIAANAAILTEAWGLADPRVEPNDAGMNSQTWLVRAAKARYVAKLVPAAQHDRFVSGLAVAQLVASSGIPAGAPVATSDGPSWVRLEGNTLALLAFVEGRPLLGEHRKEQRLIGLTLARAHRALKGRDVPGAARFHWIDPSARHLDVESWVRPAILGALETWERMAPPSLTWGLVHSDPAPEAFLFNSEAGTCGLIDWDTGLVAPLMYDVASAAMYLGGPERSKAFVDAYVAERVLHEAEVDRALEPMLRLRWAVQADYFARRIANRDLTGIAGLNENRVGLEDARRGLGV